MLRFRLPRIVLVLMAASMLMSSTAVAAEPNAEPAPEAREHARATFEGREIPMVEAVKHHCHDKFFPEVRCFPTEEASLADQNRPHNDAGEPTASLNFTDGLESSADAAAGVTLYTIFYQDWFYGGASWAAYGNISNLNSIGWDNEITSFKLYNGARPRWFTGSSYTGSFACWTSSQSWLQGGWSDSISSINAARFSC